MTRRGSTVPPKLGPLLREQFAFLDSGLRTPSEIRTAFDTILDAIEANFVAAEAFGVDGHDGVVILEELRATVLAMREERLPPGTPESYVTPRRMTLWDVAVIVYGDATRVSLLYAANPVTDSARLPVGMTVLVPPLS